MMAATEPLAQWAIRNIGPPEIFALVFFGLAVASSVGGNTIWKGWMSVLLGLLIATIGQDPVGGINRYNFGLSDLAAGIAFVPAILGFFAVSEIFIQAEKKAFGKHTHQNSMLISQRSGNYGVTKSPLYGQFLLAFSAVSCPELVQHLPPSWAMAKRCAGQKIKSHLVRVILKGLFHLKPQIMRPLARR